jgi:hypothetical protein
MHSIGKKNKYIGLLFMKINKEYFALGREGIHKVSTEHVDALAKYSDRLTHMVCTGLDGRYDQITIMEADSLEEIHQAAVDFKMGAKAGYIDISDVAIGIKAPPRARVPGGGGSVPGTPGGTVNPNT